MSLYRAKNYEDLNYFSRCSSPYATLPRVRKNFRAKMTILGQKLPFFGEKLPFEVEKMPFPAKSTNFSS